MHVQEKGQTLAVNFGKELAEAFEEERLWSSLGYSVSKSVTQLQSDAERLRLLRKSVETLIRSNNQASRWHLSCVVSIHRYIILYKSQYFEASKRYLTLCLEGGLPKGVSYTPFNLTSVV